ncbi:hypothetical protein QFC20_007640 [Naganishia adeliensis]|uniref:Uncharacterized protein n=1 Tax=Naganishia adeliensis TaxID=92952 RepID=A0ACC2UX88_9TREE|nr:hypothetical protein QFC20_007640 [Naganishia adeliensis]
MSAFPQSSESTVSHWQATNRGRDSLYGHNKDASVPHEADIVIVGGGTMGVSLAYFLTREGAEGAGKKVVVLEARDVGSGGSSKTKNQTSTSGVDASAKTPLINNCSVNETKKGSDVQVARYHTWLAAREKYGLTAAHGTTLITDPDEAKKVSRFNQAYSCQLRPAASVHSHRLCTALMRKAIESSYSDCQLFTHAPVTSIDKTDDGKWNVKTAKGDVKAGRVVLCTNAYTKNFYDPEKKDEELLHSHIRPAYAQCSLITPPPTYSGLNALKHTYNADGSFYLVQTPSGGIVLGGWNLPLVKGREKTYQRVGNDDDSCVMPQWTKFLANYCKTRFANWGDQVHGEGATRTWSGLMTDSKDALPLVGEVPGKDGMFLSAGFHGHGQSRIIIVAQGLAGILKTGQWASQLPVSFQLTMERLERSRHVETVLDEYSDLKEEIGDVAMQVESMIR